jgi:hypothetical protein
MIRLLIEDVTLIKAEHITANVRFKGGSQQTLTISRPLNAWQERTTDGEVIAEIDRLLNDYTTEQVAAILNQKGLRSGTGLLFTAKIVTRLCRVNLGRNRGATAGVPEHREDLAPQWTVTWPPLQ